jgi:transposase
MDCSAARSTDVDALLAQIAALTAQVAEQDARIAQEQAEKEALARKLAQEAAESAELARKLAEETAKNAALEDALAAADDEVRRITEILAMFKRRQFGPGSEKLDPDQFELTLEDLEIALSRAETEVEAALDKAGDGKQRKRRRKNLGALPAHLERIELLVDIESKSCPCCNGDLHVIGEDASERLDVVPAQFRVLVTRRPRYGCRGCDGAGVIQAPAPSFVVDQGIPTDALVAQVVVAKYADHCPLYRIC